MHNGIGELRLSLNVEDFRDKQFPSANKTYSAHADVDFRFKQHSGSEPLQLTTPFMSYHTDGGGSLQVAAAYTDGGPVERGPQIGRVHSVILQFTYSSNTSHTQGATVQVGGEVSGGGYKATVGASSTSSTTVTDSSISWVREIQFTSWDVPKQAVSAPRGGKP